MAVHLRILLILTGLTGIHSITTVSKVSVKAGGSISIPCLYDSQYRYHVKYLCQGYYWNRCSYAVKTNQPSSGKFLISDDKTQNIFTVTIKDLTDQDTDYWCAVEISEGLDVREYFHLSVTRGVSSLYVDHQSITGFKGEYITISCYHHNYGEMKWCRLGSYCMTESSRSIDGTTITLRNSRVPTVTMSGLKTESSGWYFCNKGDLQMPVHVTVTEKPPTTTISTTTHLTTTSSTPEPVILTTGFAYKDPTTAQAEQRQYRDSVDRKSLIIPLSFVIFIVTVTLFIWLMLKKHKKSEAAPTAAVTATEEGVTYSTIKHKRKTPRQTHTESDVDVLYSSVVIRQKGVPKVKANDDNVIYSTVA